MFNLHVSLYEYVSLSARDRVLNLQTLAADPKCESVSLGDEPFLARQGRRSRQLET